MSRFQKKEKKGGNDNTNLVHILCYHLCYHFYGGITYVVIMWCYHFSQSANAIIFMLYFPFVLSFMLSCDVIMWCYHVMLSFIVIISPFFFSWKRDTLHEKYNIKQYTIANPDLHKIKYIFSSTSTTYGPYPLPSLDTL